MFRSLRTRLWLSYALLIIIALSITALVLILFLIRNPLIYRNIAVRMQAAQAAVQAANPPSGDRLAEIAQDYGVRILVFDQGLSLRLDTGSDQSSLSFPRSSNVRATGIERDGSGKPWFYAVKRLADGSWLVIAAPRPKVAVLLALLTDELTTPFAEGAAIALVLSLVAAVLVARWMAGPLEQVVAAARTMPSDSIPHVEERGPEEVRTLARAFNAMVDRVRTSSRSQRDFVANVSHELKTPLASLVGFIETLRGPAAGDAEARQRFLEIMQEQAQRMRRLVDDIMSLSRIELDEHQTPTGRVELLPILQHLMETLQVQAMTRRISFRLERQTAESDTLDLTGDRDQLIQVFQNLLDNAVKYGREGSVVVIAVARTGGERLPAPRDPREKRPAAAIEVAVIDQGEGIPPEHLSRLTERFYRVDRGRSRQLGGTGLGLAIVKHILNRHGGRLTIESKLGQGSRFAVLFPAAAASDRKA